MPTYEELMKKYTDAQIEIENLKLEVQNLTKIIFGARREKIYKPTPYEGNGQISLFENEIQTDEEIEKEVEKNIKEITVYRKKKNKTRKAGIKRSFLKDIIIEERIIRIPVDENGNILAVCPECGGLLEEIGKKFIRQEIEFIPATLKINEYIEYRYKCEKCGTDGSKSDNHMIIEAKAPKPILNHSFASPSLVAEVMYEKYFSGMPLYRQEQMWSDRGLVLPRNMMANWIIKVSEYYLEPLWKLMLQLLKKNCELLHRRRNYNTGT